MDVRDQEWSPLVLFIQPHLAPPASQVLTTRRLAFPSDREPVTQPDLDGGVRTVGSRVSTEVVAPRGQHTFGDFAAGFGVCHRRVEGSANVRNTLDVGCIAAPQLRKRLNVSYQSPSNLPNPNEIDALGRQELRRREEASQRSWMPDEDDQRAAGVGRRGGLMERVRSIFRRGDSPAHPSESVASGEDVWAAERQHRREDEQDQSGGGERTLPQTRHRA